MSRAVTLALTALRDLAVLGGMASVVNAVAAGMSKLDATLKFRRTKSCL